MNAIRMIAGAIALALVAPVAGAQTVTLPQVKNAGGASVPSQGSVLIDSSGAEKGTVANPIVVSGGTGSSGSSTPTGTAGSPNAAVVTIQGIASATPIKVDGTATTQPISAAVLPLPAGAATAGNQTLANTSLASISGQLPASLGQKASAASASVVIASDQSAIPVAGAIADGAADSGNSIKVGAVVSGSFSALTTGNRAPLITDTYGNLRAAMVAKNYSGSWGIANSGLLGLYAYNSNTAGGPLTVASWQYNGSTWDPVGKPSSVARLLSSAATTNATNVKTTYGNLYSLQLQNTSASARYLKFYNKAMAPTVGTDTPVRTIYLPPTSTTIITWPNPLYFSTGIGYAITGAAADSDTTAVTAGDIVCLNIDYL